MTHPVPSQSRTTLLANAGVVNLTCIVGMLVAGGNLRAGDAVLDGTELLTIRQPLDALMVEGINRFCLRELAASRERRTAVWKRDFSSVEAYAASIAANRDRFRDSIGAVDARLTAMEPNRFDFELLGSLERPSIAGRTDAVTVHAVRWQVLEGVTAEGLLLVPEEVRGCVVAIPDSDWTPETFCGLSGALPEQVQFARRLAGAGCLIAVPTLINRSDEFSGHPDVGLTNQPHREFIYRQAFALGRHVIGYEVQKLLAAVDLFEQLGRRRIAGSPRRLPIGVAGVGEGGLLALYAAALDSRIDATLVSGYFQEREAVWQEPIYRNIWGLLSEFGDAELAGMVAPRGLVIEACRSVDVAGPPVARAGRRKSAAPGRIGTAALDSVRAEFARAAPIFQRLGAETAIVLAISGEAGEGPAGTTQAVAAFARVLGVEVDGADPPAWQAARPPDQAEQRRRQKRQCDELQAHVQRLLGRSAQVRDRRWQGDRSSMEQWIASAGGLRAWVYDDLIGRVAQSPLPPNARSRLVLQTDAYLGYEVVLDVFDDVIAGGILLLPKGMQQGEKRPVVVCQHGLEGTAMDTISRRPDAYQAYKAFSDQLCRRGFIVYAPQNPYRGGDRFRSIQRKSNPLKRSLFSYIIAQHRQTLDWLATLPNVDPHRIAFYGHSYGGKTAMRVPPMLDRYCLSICSGDFTDWVRSIATNQDRYGYAFTGEYEIPEWNMGHVAGYAELAMLMAPRPFMVEQGYRDGGAPAEWVAGEFGKVRRHYEQLKIADRAEIEFFDGPHTINGQGTFRFLQRHLRWPPAGS